MNQVGARNRLLVSRLVRSGVIVLALAASFGAGFLINAGDRKASQQELDLVRKVYDARDNYQVSLEKLVTFYAEASNEEGRQAAEKELRDYHLNIKPPYAPELDLPSPDLRPNQTIAKANQLFREAIEWIEKPSFTEKGENYKRAEILLRRLIRDFPNSDKLDEACYYLGEIYSSRYFNQPRRGVAFFERVIFYEPNQTWTHAIVPPSSTIGRWVTGDAPSISIRKC